MTRYYRLALETGAAHDDDGNPVNWAACPDLPGAYAETGVGDDPLPELRPLVVRILTEHILREDPLDPAIVGTDAPTADADDTLLIAITEDDLDTVRHAPMMHIEVPEP